MWRALFGLIAGCATASRPPAAATVEASPGCSIASWRDAVRSTRRAWLASAEPATSHPQRPIQVDDLAPDPVVVLGAAGDDVRVATVSANLVVTRWVPATALHRVTVERSAVSAVPDAPVDPAVEVLPGYPLAATTEPWVALDPAAARREGFALAGFVPASTAGTIWDEPAPPVAHDRVANDAELLTEPRPGAPVRMHVSAQLDLAVAADGSDAGWWAATVYLPHAIVHGFVAAPRTGHRWDFASDTIESGDDNFAAFGGGMRLAAETCLYATPGGPAVGMVRTPLDVETPKWTDLDGWHAVELPTAWGRATYYTFDAATVSPPRAARDWKPFGVE